MKSNVNINKDPFRISDNDLKQLEITISSLEMLRETGKISEDTINSLGNIITTLAALKENYLWVLLRAAKQNRLLD